LASTPGVLPPPGYNPITSLFSQLGSVGSTQEEHNTAGVPWKLNLLVVDDKKDQQNL
jgi:hypothetical protein